MNDDKDTDLGDESVYPDVSHVLHCDPAEVGHPLARIVQLVLLGSLDPRKHWHWSLVYQYNLNCVI